MTDQAATAEIFVEPGGFYFGGDAVRVRTVLGSCVSLVFWHPQRRLGGMSHFMLPGRAGRRNAPRDGRYADESMELLLERIEAAATHPRDYRVKLFGGGNMFPDIARAASGHVGTKNVMAARLLIDKHGFNCVFEHVEGLGHRNLVFDVRSGEVMLRHAADFSQAASPARVSGPAGALPGMPVVGGDLRVRM